MSSSPEGRPPSEEFAAWVPRLARRHFLGASGPPQAASVRALHACVLVADVAGFTRMVEELAVTGRRSAEQVQGILNRCFTPLVDRIEAAGGEVLKFAGDAALALWIADDADSLGTAARRALHCAQDIQREFSTLHIADGLDLHLKLAIGTGAAWATCVGGTADRWELLVRGPAIDQLREPLSQAQPGQLVVSPATASLTGLAAANAGACVRVEVATDLGPLPEPSPPHLQPVVDEAALHPFVPRALQARLAAGQADWLAEYRRVSVAFVGIDGLAPDGDDLDRVQAMMQAIQGVVMRYGGSVNQVVADEKGTTVVLAFGLALHAHEDDARRAILASFDIQNELQQLRLGARIGITTERVFTGRRGSPSRAEFAVIGGSVNLAARLMKAAEGILCDAGTRAGAGQRILFESLPQVRVKGRAEPVQIYRPRAVLQAEHGWASTIIGRSGECRILERKLDDLANRQGGVVFVEGEPGIGKTRLLRHLIERASERGVRTLGGAGDAIEQGTPLLAWRAVVEGLLGVEASVSPAEMRRRLQERLGDTDPGRASLLNPVLPFLLPVSDTVAHISPQGRADALRDMLESMLADAAEREPVLLVLEDGHWLDSASWELAAGVADRVPGVLLVVSLRPVAERAPECRRLMDDIATSVLRLDVLGESESLRLLSRRLGVDAVSEEVAALIHERSEGHPFYTEELAYALRDDGTLEIVDGECRLSGSSREATRTFPDTVSGVITSRIDRLSPEGQLLLKVAAVVGRDFELEALVAAHPLGSNADEVRLELDAIASVGLVSPRGDETWTFRHALIWESTYELLPTAQGSELHRRAAEWIETRHALDLGAYEPRLAHHYEQAGVAERAMHYLERAGERALQHDFSNVEAARFFERLLALDAQHPRSETGDAIRMPGGAAIGALDLQRARWERQLGHALFNEGRHVHGLPHIERSLALLGKGLPRRSTALATLAGGIARRLVVAPRQVRSAGDPKPVREAMFETVLASERYSRACYTLGRSTDGMAVAFRALPLAERLGPCVELCNSYAIFANIAAFVGRAKIARRYAELSLRASDEVDDPLARAVSLSRAQLFRTTYAEWEVKADYLEALALFDAQGNHYEWEEAASSLSRVEFLMGDFDATDARARAVLVRARASESIVHQLWALGSLADVAFRRGYDEAAIALAEQALSLADSTGTADTPTRFQVHGILAATHLRREAPELAVRHIAPALEAMQNGGALGYASQSGYAGLGEVLGAPTIQETGVEPDVAAALRSLRSSASRVGIVRPVIRPWTAFLIARQAQLRGQTGRAQRALRRAGSVARALALPYEAAFADAELARMGGADADSAARSARTVFAELGCEGELARMDAAEAG